MNHRMGYRFACWLERFAAGLRSDLGSEMGLRDQARWELERVSVLLKTRFSAPAKPLHISRRKVTNAILLLAAAMLIAASVNPWPRSALITIGAAYLVATAFVIHIGLDIREHSNKE